jgi:hypothetical protein
VIGWLLCCARPHSFSLQYKHSTTAFYGMGSASINSSSFQPRQKWSTQRTCFLERQRDAWADELSWQVTAATSLDVSVAGRFLP